MPRYAPNKMPTVVKRRYFELIRTGLSAAAAAQRVGVSLSCGSLWFIDAGRVSFVERPISPRHVDLDRADVGQHRLGPHTVAGVPAVLARQVALFIAQVIGDLTLER